MFPSTRFSTPATVWMFCLAMPRVARVPQGSTECGVEWRVSVHKCVCRRQTFAVWGCLDRVQEAPRAGAQAPAGARSAQEEERR